MKKRFLNLFLALALVVCVMPMVASAAQGQCNMTDHKWVNGKCSIATCAYECKHDAGKEIVPGYAATCTKEGRTDGERCAICKLTLKSQRRISKTDHDYAFQSMVTDATCTEARVNNYKCKNCDATKTDTSGAALGHNYPAQGTIIKQSTCLEEGVEEFKCSRCDETKTETIAKQEHAWQGLSEVPATCMEDGKTAGTWCWKCKTVRNGMERIPATGEHNYSVHVKMVHDATCTEKRVDIKKCATCDATKEVESGGLLAHTVVGYGEIPATCIKDGVTAGSKCRICNTVINGMETIPATGVHDYAFVSMVHDATCQEPRLNNYKCKNCDATKQDTTGGLLPCNIVNTEYEAPTCIEKGKTAGTKCTTCRVDGKYTCAYCKENMVPQEYIDPLGHDHVLVKTNKKVTCTRDGEGVYDCTRCGYDGVVKVIPKLGHSDVEEILRDATCTRDGWKEVTCSNEGCGKCVTVLIPATGHTEEIIPEVPATCTATGLSEGKKCSVCGEILTAQTVTSMTSHEFTVDVDGVDATCTADGYTAHKKCAHCDATQGKEEIDTDGHNFVNYVCTVCGVRDGSCEHEGASITVQDPTCTADGKESFSCPTCGYSYEEVLEATGHNEQVHTTAGDCRTQGKTWSTCTVCGQITVPEAATGYGGHNYVNNQCTVCGEVNPESICNHTGGRSFQTDAATCTHDGITIETCDDCGNVVDRVIEPAKGHNYVNGICSRCNKKNSNRITNDYQDVFVVG